MKLLVGTDHIEVSSISRTSLYWASRPKYGLVLLLNSAHGNNGTSKIVLPRYPIGHTLLICKTNQCTPHHRHHGETPIKKAHIVCKRCSKFTQRQYHSDSTTTTLYVITQYKPSLAYDVEGTCVSMYFRRLHYIYWNHDLAWFRKLVHATIRYPCRVLRARNSRFIDYM